MKCFSACFKHCMRNKGVKGDKEGDKEGDKQGVKKEKRLNKNKKREEDALDLSVEAGLEMEERSVLWRINNFPVIFKNDDLINRQALKFVAGTTIGQPSQWMVFLRVDEKAAVEMKWIQIYYSIMEPSPSPGVHLYSQMSFAIRDGEGTTIWSRDLEMLAISDFSPPPNSDSGDVAHYGFRMIHLSNYVPPETLEIQLTLKLYAQTRRPKSRVQTTLVKFHEKAMAKARKDLVVQLQDPIPGDVKVVSGDGREFLVPNGILSTRSPVFAAMLRTNMAEAASGRIDIPDISGKGLEVLLHFIYTGELPSGWKDSGVIVELTNGAAKYQLMDLLEFLDMTLGKLCHVDNVAPLLSLAYRLPLKTAQEELLKFVKEKGVRSVEKFSQIMEAIAISAMESVNNN